MRTRQDGEVPVIVVDGLDLSFLSDRDRPYAENYIRFVRMGRAYGKADEEGFRPVHATTARLVWGQKRYPRLLDLLKRHGVVEVNPSYRPGLRSKSHRLAEPLPRRPIQDRVPVPARTRRQHEEDQERRDVSDSPPTARSVRPPDFGRRVGGGSSRRRAGRRPAAGSHAGDRAGSPRGQLRRVRAPTPPLFRPPEVGPPAARPVGRRADVRVGPPKLSAPHAGVGSSGVGGRRSEVGGRDRLRRPLGRPLRRRSDLRDRRTRRPCNA